MTFEKSMINEACTLVRRTFLFGGSQNKVTGPWAPVWSGPNCVLKNKARGAFLVVSYHNINHYITVHESQNLFST